MRESFKPNAEAMQGGSFEDRTTNRYVYHIWKTLFILYSYMYKNVHDVDRDTISTQQLSINY